MFSFMHHLSSLWNLLIFSLVLVKEIKAQHVTSSFVSTHTFQDLSVLKMTKDSHWYKQFIHVCVSLTVYD
jgi:hypothetical protein